MSVGVRWGRSIIVVRRRLSERSGDDSRRESVERSEELTAEKGWASRQLVELKVKERISKPSFVRSRQVISRCQRLSLTK